MLVVGVELGTLACKALSFGFGPFFSCYLLHFVVLIGTNGTIMRGKRKLQLTMSIAINRLIYHLFGAKLVIESDMFFGYCNLVISSNQ